jgi:hypothetical protein
LPSQDESPDIKKLRSQMREGRTPLLQAIREAYKPYLLARKALERQNSAIREQVGLLSSDFDAKAKQLRESSRKTGENPAMVVELYKALSQQAKSVAALIDKELPSLQKLYDPVAKAFAAYEGALDAYNKYMQQWVGKLPEGDLSGRALELVQTEIERSLR